ncbi:ARID DNA-binding domain-containing protein [Tanacetum coccineum]|uniref:ARID DNA-binding domain-containing protein n=2 Tax=Tanacetum coccineum TaxID=301880 RepID=A0ABQ5AEN2_9ASTR
MVSYNHIIRKNLRLQRAANSQRLQWHQSRWFDTWKKKPTYHQWNNHEMRYSLSNGTAEVVPRSCCNRRLSHETRAMLKAKIKENEAYNTSGVCATLKQTRKDKRARCFACKERGHVVWNCPHKRNKMKGKIEASQPRYTEELKYPEVVHVTTDFMVNGSGEKDWNRIWYISKEYKNHMTPVKSNFKRMKGEFKMLEKEERQRKFIFSYGVGEAFVETENGTKVISNVFYTPEITLNVLSLEQLENQGYVVTVEGNKCVIKYMFDEDRGMLDANEDRDMVEDSTAMVKSHNEYLDDYFKSIDPTEECSLIKGMEDLKMKEEDTHDYVDDRYLSMNGTLYHFKINSFPRFISFLDLVKIDKLVYPNWEIMGKKFMELLEWFYIDFMGQEVLGNLPPEIGLNKIDLLALYKFVDDMGGYMIVSLDKKWGKVAELFGLGQEHQDEVKELYKEYIGMAKVYYEEAKRSKHGKPGIVGENCIGDAGNGRPQGDARMEDAEVEEGKPDKTQGTDDQDDVKGNNSSDAASNKEAQSMTSSDDLIIIV